MTDIKDFLEKASGLPVEDTAFTKPPKLPWIVFLDDFSGDGDDFHMQIGEHNLAVELYAERIEIQTEKKLEAAFEAKGWKYERGRVWLNSEKMFETIYTINFTEKR